MKLIMEKLRKNWLGAVLLAAVIVLLARDFPRAVTMTARPEVSDLVGVARMGKVGSVERLPIPTPSPFAPAIEKNRLVVKNSNLSLVVTEVRKAIDGIVKGAEERGGFLVESSLDVPEGGATGMVTVRIPSERLDDGLAAIRALGVRIVSERVMGTDVTDQFVDLEARLATLVKTKAKFEQIMTAATQIQDILEVQREIINLQSQIDSLKGQEKYLEQTAKLSLVTVYLATDELALPYAPAQPWRPSAIFKQAVRSLIGSLRGVATALIWAAVYAPVWGLVVLGYWLIRKRWSRGG